MSGDKRSPFHGSRKKSRFKEQGKRTSGKNAADIPQEEIFSSVRNSSNLPRRGTLAARKIHYSDELTFNIFFLFLFLFKGPSLIIRWFILPSPRERFHALF